MFLIKVSHKYGKDLIDPERVWDLSTRLVRHFRSVPASKWHLTKLMTYRLERIATILDPNVRIGRPIELATSPVEAETSLQEYNTHQHHPVSEPCLMAHEPPMIEFPSDPFFDCNLDFGLTPMFPFESMAPNIDNMPF